MIRSTLRSSLALAVAATLAACQAYPTGSAPATTPGLAVGAKAEALGPKAPRVLLHGKVRWSDLRRLMATSTDVATNAIVSLIDDTGTPVAGGVAGGGGDFTLFAPDDTFEAAPNATYTLDVMRRTADDATDTLLSLRTVVTTDAEGDFTSITGTSIVISAETTAIAQLGAASETDAADLMETFMPNTDEVYEFVPFGDYTQEAFEAKVDEIEAKLLENADPNRKDLPTIIEGDYVIETAADLAELAIVEEITGYLDINYTGDKPISLPKLETIGGYLQLQRTGASTDLTGLSALTTLDGSLLLYAGTLQSLDGLQGLTALPGGLTLRDNATLTSLTGLENVTTIGTVDFPNVRIENCTALADLSGLSGLETVIGNFELTNLSAGLTSLDGLDALTSIDGGLSLLELDGLASLDGIETLDSLDNLGLSDLPALSSIAALGGTAFEPEAEVSLVNLPQLGSLAGLEGLGGHVERLSIQICPALENISAPGTYSAITQLDGFTLDRTPITSLATLFEEPVDIGSFYWRAPSGSEGPTSLASMSDVRITGSFHLDSLPALVDLDGPSFVAELGDLRIDSCTALPANFAGFANLGAITQVRRLNLNNIPALTSVGMLGIERPGGIGVVDPQLRITNCPLFSGCEANDYAAAYYVSTNLSNVANFSGTDQTCFNL